MEPRAASSSVWWSVVFWGEHEGGSGACGWGFGLVWRIYRASAAEKARPQWSLAHGFMLRVSISDRVSLSNSSNSSNLRDSVMSVSTILAALSSERLLNRSEHSL